MRAKLRGVAQVSSATLVAALGAAGCTGVFSSEDCRSSRTCSATPGRSDAGNAGQSADGEGGDSRTDNGGAANAAAGANQAGVGGAGEGGTVGCTGSVADDAACWTTNELGVFVSSDNGDDAAGDGTMQAPFKTITKGIAEAAGKNVYVCAGANDYAERVSLDVRSDGIHIYGGFECALWTYSAMRSARVRSPSNIALRIDGLKKGAHIENVGFQAANAVGTGADASSYAAVVTNSKGVTLTNVELKAGTGAEGEHGSPGGPGNDGAIADAAQDGKSAVCSGDLSDVAGGSWSAPACGSKGGSGGGASQANGGNGIDGIPAEHVNPATGIYNGGDGSPKESLAGGDGDDGMTGDAGEDAPAGSVAGSFSFAGFAAADGKAGSVGFPGQGGGGGGASKGSASCRGASGGAGGMGGCGGTGGGAGRGGGASVGVLSWGSDIALVGCLVRASSGGSGGNGGAGGVGGLGKRGGEGGAASGGKVVIARAGRGGLGGNGGSGGSGSGGGGGPSIALVHSGGVVVYDADTLLQKALGGAGGEGGAQAASAPKGANGESVLELQID